MTRKEVLEFLELPESSTDNDIRVRMNDKLTYFQRLSENAPNDFLRKLHTSNTEKIKTLQIEMLGASDASNNNPVKNNQPQVQNYQHQEPVAQAQPNATAVAWLVRHTENQSAKTFPLYFGKNFVGRANQPTNHTVVINDDPYVSRVHAMFDVISINPLQINVHDEAATNGGKPSKNGTYINGDDRQLSKRVTIRENDTIQIGMTKLIVRLNNTSIHKIVQEVEESDYMKTVVIDIF